MSNTSDKKAHKALKKRIRGVFENLEEKGDAAELARSLGFDRELISESRDEDDN